MGLVGAAAGGWAASGRAPAAQAGGLDAGAPHAERGCGGSTAAGGRAAVEADDQEVLGHAGSEAAAGTRVGVAAGAGGTGAAAVGASTGRALVDRRVGCPSCCAGAAQAGVPPAGVAGAAGR